MDYSAQKKYFHIAYRTGSDHWTKTVLPFRDTVLAERLAPNSLILDLGSGRGRFPFDLVKRGFRVIGIDYVGEVVKKNNHEVKLLGLDKNLRFMEADALDIPLSDASFDAVTDVGLIQHVAKQDWAQYIGEISRVLKPGGYCLLAALSKETSRYLTWTPKSDANPSYEREGVLYYFFTGAEIALLFQNAFDLVSFKVEYTSDREPIAYITVLMKKKA